MIYLLRTATVSSLSPYTDIPGLQQAVQILHLALSCFYMSCNFMSCIFSRPWVGNLPTPGREYMDCAVDRLQHSNEAKLASQRYGREPSAIRWTYTLDSGHPATMLRAVDI